jgi:hypothetical protein
MGQRFSHRPVDEASKMNARVDWHGDELEPKLRAAVWEAIVRCTEFFWAHCLQLLNISNPPPHKTPSQPGEAPRKRTGFLQGNVQREYDEPALTSRVGISKNAIYGLFLELGTRYMRPRPWLMATLKAVMPQLQATIAAVKLEGE